MRGAAARFRNTRHAVLTLDLLAVAQARGRQIPETQLPLGALLDEGAPVRVPSMDEEVEFKQTWGQVLGSFLGAQRWPRLHRAVACIGR